ncbi:MAG: TolC family protein [Lysobacter sp.]|nr:MAG: TolC family protein [Lysobacter sp.]
MSLRLAACAAWVAVLWAPGVLQAAPPDSSPLPSSEPQSAAGRQAIPLAPLPLREALRAAWARHPAAMSVSAQKVAARARLDAAGRPLYNPGVEVAVDKQGPDTSVTGGLSLTLDWHDKRGARRDAAAARLTQVEATARRIQRDFVRQWFASWADLQTARQRVATGERRLALVTRFVEVARRQFVAQDISGLERDFAQLALDEARAEQSRLLAEVAEAEARFRSVGGDPTTVSIASLPTNQLPRQTVQLGDVELLPDLQVAKAAALAAERDVTVAERNRRGDPTVAVRAGRIDLDGLQDNVLGASVSIPLFVRNTYRAEVTAAQADAQAAGADAARIRLELEAERMRAVSTYAATRDTWARWEASRGTDVDRRTNLLERLLREGELSPSDYLVQLRQTLDTQLAGAELEARVWRAWTDYLAATGQLERWAGLEATP